MLNQGGPSVLPVKGENFVVTDKDREDVSPLALVTQQLALVQREQLLYVLASPFIVALRCGALLPILQDLGVLFGSVLGEVVQPIPSRVTGR